MTPTMASKANDINIQQSMIMRGMAICMIMMHNYCHLLEFTIGENESTYSKESAIDFFSQLTVYSNEWVYNLFSFLGWYGVPVFIFLTGYGLVRKYEDEESKPMEIRSFLLKNWFKLFALILPGVLFYIVFDLTCYCYSGKQEFIVNILDHLFLLTFLNDIIGLWFNVHPGVYWYFGFTMELYILYALVIYRRNNAILIIITVLSIAFQFVAYKRWMGESESLLWWIRQNFAGWMMPFAFGILYARSKPISKKIRYLIYGVSVLLFLPTMLDFILWQVSLLCAIILSIGVATISMKIPYWKDIWVSIGRLSPFIFAAHPIVRLIFLGHLTPLDSPNNLLFTCYILAVFLFAGIYKFSWKIITPRLKKCFDKFIMHEV